MFEGLFMLLALSAVMAIASFLAGTLPLSFTLSQSQLRLLSTLGMGVLVGTSLIVIIPEGIETLYSASRHEGAAKRLAARGPIGGWELGIQWAAPVWERKGSSDTIYEDGDDLFEDYPATDLSPRGGTDPPKTPTEPGVIGILGGDGDALGAVPGYRVGAGAEAGSVAEAGTGSTAGSNSAAKEAEAVSHEDADGDTDGSPHAWVGISLISGFILMYLVDTLPQLAPVPVRARSNIYSLSDLSTSGGSGGSSGPGGSAGDSAAVSYKAGISTTLGLLIHAFADGIALGASSSMPGLSFVVFFAIMVHKAPAAFGLTTVLLRQGLTKRQARVHLVAFSLAAPAGAVVTWLVAGLLGGLSGYAGGGEAGMKWWTGLILLFSGGTFLYVAMHTMQENDAQSSSDENGHSGSNGYLGLDGRDSSHSHRHGHGRGGGSPKSLKLVGAAVAGMLLPAITQIGHAH